MESELVVPLWINGKEELASSAFSVISPHTNQKCWGAATATHKDAIRAVEAAETAFPSWSRTRPTTRQDILFKAADLLEARAEEYAGFMSSEMGADTGVARYFVLALSIKMLKDIASRIPTICGSVPTCQEEGTSAIIYKEPYGVVLGIVPWYGALMPLYSLRTLILR